MDINKILGKLGVSDLNDMQKAASDAILHTENDVVVLSPTGSGKTLAYLLPLLQMVDAASPCVQAIVIVPGRELALQSATVMKNMGSGLRCFASYGGRPTMEEHRAIRELQPQVIFATPGRLNDHLDKMNFSSDKVKYLVIDEFDKCLEMGFQAEMEAVIGKLPSVERHILLSATNAEQIPHYLRQQYNVQPVTLDYLGEQAVAGRVAFFEVRSPEKDKLDTLASLLCTLGDKSCIVFLNYRDSVERTAQFLTERGFSLSFFHGGLDQKERERSLYRFSNGSVNIMVSTDLASRGLDIPEVDAIIHYHLPESKESYVHRVGRTARWEAHGNTFFILGPEEQVPDYVDADIELYAIPESLPKPALSKMVTLYIGKGKMEKISKGDIVGFLCKKGGLKSSDIGRIDVNDRYSYVAIARTAAKSAISRLQGEKIKGVKTVVEEVI